MANIKVGIKFRPILDREQDKEIKWTSNGDKISTVNQKYKFTCGESYSKKLTSSV